MKPIELYEWIAGTMSNFTKPFQENEALFNQAKAFWRHLDSSLMIAIVIFLVLEFGKLYFWSFELRWLLFIISLTTRNLGAIIDHSIGSFS